MTVLRSGARRPAAFLAAFLGLAALAGQDASAQSRRPLMDETLTGNYLAGRTAVRENDFDAAVNFYSRALRADPANPEILGRTFLLRVTNGDIDQAAPLATRYLTQDKSNDLARFTLAAKAIKDKSYSAAKTGLASVDRSPMSQLTATLLLAWMSQGLGDTDGALKILDGLTGGQGYDFFKNYHRALIADLAGRRADALAAMKAAYDIDHSSLRIVEAYARILARNGNSAAAQKALLDFADGRTQPAVTSLLKEINLGRTPAPLVRDAAEGSAELFFSLAQILNRDQTIDLYVIYLQLAVYINPRSDYARLALGGYFQDVQNYNKAIGVFRAMPEDSPLRPNAVIGAAFSLDALKKTDEAAAQLRKLIEKDPNDLQSLTALGDVYRSAKRYAEALTAYNEAIATIKQPAKVNWSAFYNRGIVLERLKRWPEAEADFKKALELSPDQPSVLNYLGYSWVDMGMNLDEGLAMLNKAVSLRPDDGFVIDSLGWAYYRLGRYDEAVTQLEKAVQLQPGDPTINDHLGDVYWHVGRKLEAVFQWSHARDLKPEPEDLAKIVQKLESGVPDDANKKG